MNKPAYAAIQTYSPDKPVLIFVSSRRQTRLTAFDLVAFVAAQNNPKQWLYLPESEVRIIYVCIHVCIYVHVVTCCSCGRCVRVHVRIYVHVVTCCLCGRCVHVIT